MIITATYVINKIICKGTFILRKLINYCCLYSSMNIKILVSELISKFLRCDAHGLLLGLKIVYLLEKFYFLMYLQISHRVCLNEEKKRYTCIKDLIGFSTEKALN